MWQKLSIISLVGLMGLLCSPAKGQTYDQGIGLRGGVTSGITYKNFVGESAALDLIVGFQYDGLQVHGLYEIHTQAFGQKGLNWYYGVGGHVGFYSDDYDPPYDDYDHGSEPVFGVDGILGIEYKIQEIPFTIGVDIKPFLEFTDPGLYFWDAGLTVRFTF